MLELVERNPHIMEAEFVMIDVSLDNIHGGLYGHWKNDPSL
jgi:hypothetical protein